MYEKPGTKLQHYKGGRYTVIGLSTHSETLEEMVVYQNDADKRIWVRPLDMFYEDIDNDYYRGPRFKVID